MSNGLGALDLAPGRRQAILRSTARPCRRGWTSWTWTAMRTREGPTWHAPTAARTTASPPSSCTWRRSTPSSTTPRAWRFRWK